MSRGRVGITWIVLYATNSASADVNCRTSTVGKLKLKPSQQKLQREQHAVEFGPVAGMQRSGMHSASYNCVMMHCVADMSWTMLITNTDGDGDQWMSQHMSLQDRNSLHNFASCRATSVHYNFIHTYYCIATELVFIDCTLVSHNHKPPTTSPHFITKIGHCGCLQTTILILRNIFLN